MRLDYNAPAAKMSPGTSKTKVIIVITMLCICAGCGIALYFTFNPPTSDVAPYYEEIADENLPGNSSPVIINDKPQGITVQEPEYTNVEGAHDKANLEYLFKEIGDNTETEKQEEQQDQ